MFESSTVPFKKKKSVADKVKRSARADFIDDSGSVALREPQNV